MKILAIDNIKAPLELPPGENLVLRIFLDKTLVEVFANDRQAMIANHVPPPGHTSISLLSEGGETPATAMSGWQMNSIYRNNQTAPR